MCVWKVFRTERERNYFFNVEGHQVLRAPVGNDSLGLRLNVLRRVKACLEFGSGISLAFS